MTRTTPRVVIGTLLAAIIATGTGFAGGKEVFVTTGCNTCHPVSTADVKRKIADQKGPNLVNLSDRYSHEQLTLLLKRRLKIGGREVHIREFKGNDELLALLVDWLLNQKMKPGVPTRNPILPKSAGLGSESNGK